MVSAEHSQAAERSERPRWQSTQGWPLRSVGGGGISAVNSHTALDGLVDMPGAVLSSLRKSVEVKQALGGSQLQT